VKWFLNKEKFYSRLTIHDWRNHYWKTAPVCLKP